jgi:hypothetical protein
MVGGEGGWFLKAFDFYVAQRVNLLLGIIKGRKLIQQLLVELQTVSWKK